MDFQFVLGQHAPVASLVHTLVAGMDTDLLMNHLSVLLHSALLERGVPAVIALVTPHTIVNYLRDSTYMTSTVGGGGGYKNQIKGREVA